MNDRPLSNLATSLIVAFEHSDSPNKDEKIAVNLLVAKVATWYEKLRNAMDYRQEEVILRAAIERILKRRLLLGGSGKKIAEPLVRELVWAHYFPDNSVSESVIEKVKDKIDAYLILRKSVLALKKIKEGAVNEWMYHLLSSDIAQMLRPAREKEIMCNFAYQIMRDNVHITDDNVQTKDVQVFIAVRRAFAKDDVAFLRYRLFAQLVGKVTTHNAEEVSREFGGAYEEINYQMEYSRRETIYGFVKNKIPIFLILGDLLHTQKGNIREIAKNDEELTKVVFDACEARYKSISSKVRRAIIRSVFFLLLTKAFMAFTVEGAIERFFFGEVLWNSMIINITIPPLLMIIVGVFIKTPGRENSVRILAAIRSILFDEHPSIGNALTIQKNPKNSRPILNMVFTVSWFLAFFVTFGILAFVLTYLGMNYISQGIFLFFLAIVSFLSYRISLASSEYTVETKPGVLTPIFDFFFMPIIRVGRHLTEGISQVNIFLFLFDFVIETPFKGIFGFFEQWFFFLHAKREGLE